MASDMLSQEEIDALLKGGSSEEPEIQYFEDDEELLSEIEIDALGEIGNISMGTAATTLSTLLNKKVNITTPTVSITTTEELSEEYKLPFVAIDVSYKEGLQGSNILILDTDDVKIITDLMVGKDDFDISREISDFELSAVSEAMNQMMGSSSTSLSEMFYKKIDIAPPVSMEITFEEGKEKIDLLKTTSPIIKISFKIVVEDIINSSIMQLVPLEFGKTMVKNIMSAGQEPEAPEVIQAPPIEPERPRSETIKETPKIERKTPTELNNVARTENLDYNNVSKKEDKVLVQKAEFQDFATAPASSFNSSMDLIGDIPVEITVELGRTYKKIGEILEFGQGTVIELEKLVGESLDIFANRKYIAKGEVVVIDDSFGIRITEIDSSNKNII
ncbi:MAG: flagellar motor switch phosphatase FliY [Tissierellaceae bacterium]